MSKECILSIKKRQSEAIPYFETCPPPVDSIFEILRFDIRYSAVRFLLILWFKESLSFNGI